MSAQLRSNPLNRRGSITVYKEVEIDVDLSDFSDDDLVAELRQRGDACPHEPTTMREAWAAYNAMTDDTPEPIRRFIAAACGRIW